MWMATAACILPSKACGALESMVALESMDWPSEFVPLGIYGDGLDPLLDTFQPGSPQNLWCLESMHVTLESMVLGIYACNTV